MVNNTSFYREIAIKYFKLFSNKDIYGLIEMFDKNVTLRDWEIHSEGIDSVTKSIKEIFNKVDSLTIYPKIISVEINTIFAEIEIQINKTEILKVVDILEFTDSGKITAIRAFKG